MLKNIVKNIAIYGAGGFGRETACLLREINDTFPTWNFVGFFDDGIPKGTETKYGKILGGMSDLNAVAEPLNVVFAIGTPKTLKELVSKISNPRISFPNVISPACRMLASETLKIGRGNLLGFCCSISCDVEIGNFNIFVGGASIGHDAKIGNFNVLMPSVCVSGEVKIGDENFFGLKSCIHQGLSIGNRTTVAGSSLVIHSTEDGTTYVGVPAKKFKF